MRVWITRDDDWTLCLWREKPVLQDDGVWMNYNEEYCVLDSDLPKADDELVEIEVNVTSQDSSKEHIKNRRHK